MSPLREAWLWAAWRAGAAMLAAAAVLTVVAVVIGEDPAQRPVSVTSTTVGTIPCPDGLPPVWHPNGWSACRRGPSGPEPETPIVSFEAEPLRPGDRESRRPRVC